MNSKMGYASLRVSNFQGYSKISSFSRDERSLQRSQKIQNFTVPGQSFQSFKGAQGLQFQGPQGLKGLILECLHLSIHRSTAFYSQPCRITSPLATTVGCVLGVRLECGPKWMVGRCPHSLHNPSQRLSLNIDCRLHDSCSA